MARARRVLVWLMVAALGVILLAGAWASGFIAIKCYGGTEEPRPSQATASRASREVAGYAREEASTFLTLPEWYIVYNTDEYARSMTSRAPSEFPYAGSIRQFWTYYAAVCGATKRAYPFSAGNHLMLAVIGSSFSIEYALKGLYENTVGRLTERIAGYDTAEDAFGRAVATEYGTFMHSVPWYEFPFGTRAAELWRSTPARGPHMIRKWERRGALTIEYGVKAAYAWLIDLGTGATYGEEDLQIHATVENGVESAGTSVITIPRYEAFTQQTLTLLMKGVRFVDIAGNDVILVTVLAPRGWIARDSRAEVVLDEPLLTDADTRRVALKVPVAILHEFVPQIHAAGGQVEHFYDY